MANTAVVPTSMTNEDLMALLGQAGMTPQSTSGNFRRMSLKGGSLITDPDSADEEAWPPAKKGPTMTVRIVKPPVYYVSFFLSADEKNGAIDARRIGREDLNGRFVKKYDDPSEQAADTYSNVDVYDDIERVAGKRGSFKADIQVQIVPESGEMTGEEPVYTLTLSTTSAMDFRGTSKNPAGGIVQDKNFIVQLAEFAIESAGEGASKDEQATAVLNAMTALQMGGVVADVSLIQTKSEKDPSIVWTVVAFKPVYIEASGGNPALTEGDPVAADSDDIPF